MIERVVELIKGSQRHGLVAGKRGPEKLRWWLMPWEGQV